MARDNDDNDDDDDHEDDYDGAESLLFNFAETFECGRKRTRMRMRLRIIESLVTLVMRFKGKEDT